MGGMFLKGYSVLTIKRKRRYEELPENCRAYLSRHRAGTCLCHIVSLSVCFSLSHNVSLPYFHFMHPTVSYHGLSVTLHLICKWNK